MLGEKKFLKSVIAIISLIFILVLINTFFRMSLPYLLSKFIDNFYSSYEKYKYINQFLIASILLFLFSLLQKYLIENLSWKFTNHIRVELLKKILKQNNDFFIKYSHSDLLEYFEVDISKIYKFLTKSIPTFFSNIFIITLVIVFFGLKSIYIFLFFIVYLVLNFILVKMYRKNNKNKVIEESDYHEYMSGKYSEWLAMKNLSSILGLDKYIIDKFENLQDDWLKYRINVNKYYYAIWCITLLLNGMVDTFILGISGFLFFYNKITIGNIYLYYSYGQKIKNPMESLQQQLQYVEKLFASTKRIDRLLKENSNDFEENARKLVISEIKTIKIKDLYFAYTDKIVLDKLSIELSKGKNIGIYGKSGDGKSTFLKILSKIIKSNKDSVFINNIDINDIDMESYIEKIIYLQNEPVIFKTSLYNNISMFNEKISLEEVDKFLRNEDLYKYIENKKLTDIIIDEELTILQKQIISVLRVFFEKKDLIIFDEAFSHIDTKITLDLLDKIKKFNRNSIIICVSHNLEKLSSFNKMYEIKKGKIYEKE